MGFNSTLKDIAKNKIPLRKEKTMLCLSENDSVSNTLIKEQSLEEFGERNSINSSEINNQNKNERPLWKEMNIRYRYLSRAIKRAVSNNSLSHIPSSYAYNDVKQIKGFPLPGF